MKSLKKQIKAIAVKRLGAKGVVFFCSMLTALNADALHLDWSGQYRFEMVQIESPDMADGKSKDYILNQLSLAPVVIAADGFNIHSRFDILPSQVEGYENSQFGQILGVGVNDGAPSTSELDSNALAQTQNKSSVMVRELFLNVKQEFASIYLGRMPMHFGLGLTHNAGQGFFDHWYDTRDVVAIKFQVGSFFMMPMIGKVYDNKVSRGDDMVDQSLFVEYDNKETKNRIGVYLEERTSNTGANDAPAEALGGTGAVRDSRVKLRNYNFLLGKQFGDFKLDMEGGFNSGSTGVSTSAGDRVSVNAFAVVADMSYRAEGSSSEIGLRLGSVSGDNTNTPNYEGFALDKNYDLAMLMFNHRLGTEDIFKSNLYKNTNLNATNSLDDEVVSNVIFLAPSWKYDFSPKWEMQHQLLWAQLNDASYVKNGQNITLKKDLGIEWDVAFLYKPTKNITWKNQVGFFTPGSAFKTPSLEQKTSTVIGLQSSAAISF